MKIEIVCLFQAEMVLTVIENQVFFFYSYDNFKPN